VYAENREHEGARVALRGRIAAFVQRTLSTRWFKDDHVEAEQRLAAVLECSEDAIISVDSDGLITAWSPGAERLYGYTRPEVIGQPGSLLFQPGRHDEEYAALRRALAGERVASYRAERVRKDGSVVNVSLSVSPTYGLDGRMVGASSVAHDVTSTIRADERGALQAELLDEVDAAVIFADSAFVVRYWSRGAQRLYGYSAEEAIGRGLMDLMVPKSSRAAALELERTVREGVPVDGEIDVQRKQGQLVPVSFRLRPFPGGDEVGPGRGIVTIAVDISERREAEATARRNAEGQHEIANLGRFALGGGSLEDLFDHAVHIASRALSGDCADLAECLPDASGFVMRAAVGWPGERNGQHIMGDARSGPAYVASSGEAIIVEDWEQEQRFVRSSKMRERGVCSSVAVLVGDLESPFGVLAVHYTKPGAVPPDCVSFLDALAIVLADAMRSQITQDRVLHDSLHDGLTGLPNRTLFLDRVDHALVRNKRHPQPLAVFFIDLDHFKLVNDSRGHEAGDELLRLVAPRLASGVRSSDTLARLGGDEFAVLCEQLPTDMAATRIANQLASALEKPIALNGDAHQVSASIGIALATPESSASDLLRDADVAMYRAKVDGRDRAELFDEEMHASVLSRVRTEAALRSALAEEDEIYVAYQPLVSLRSGQIVGAEALARWRHPDWGPVAPAEFIPVAEDSALIHKLGALVMRRAARECSAWQDIPHFAGIAVNVSTRQLVELDEVVTLAREVIAERGFATGFLTLEITESALITRLDTAQNILLSLGDSGFGLSLDDFGTGYSSLSYLANLPFDSVKIDQSLTKDIVEKPQAEALVAAIIQMGHALEKQVIAEGVETLEQATRLQTLDCDIAQGYYFAKPLAPDMFTALLQNHPNWLLGAQSEMSFC
jgi:diguanylate cyclase (GGDEF)-like protein/PAS domain S-box-containing protein